MTFSFLLLLGHSRQSFLCLSLELHTFAINFKAIFLIIEKVLTLRPLHHRFVSQFPLAVADLVSKRQDLSCFEHF